MRIFFLSLFLLSICILFSFSSDEEIAKPDWKLNELKGKVKELQSSYYYTNFNDSSTLHKETAPNALYSLVKFNGKGFETYRIFYFNVLDSASGSRIFYHYDSENKLTEKEEQIPTNSLDNKYFYTYDKSGNVISELYYFVNLLDKQTVWVYNSANLLIEKREYNSGRDYQTIKNYPADTTGTVVTDHYSVKYTYRHDPDGNLIEMKTDENRSGIHQYKSITYKYSAGKPVEKMDGIDDRESDYSKTIYKYDKDGHLIEETNSEYIGYMKKLSVDYIETLTYNEQGLLVKDVKVDGNKKERFRRELQYDERKNIIYEDEANFVLGNDEKISKYTYDENNNWVIKKDYDTSGRLKGITERKITYYTN